MSWLLNDTMMPWHNVTCLVEKKKKKNVSWKGVSSYRADLIKNSIPYQFKGQSWQHVSASRCTASAIPDHH